MTRRIFVPVCVVAFAVLVTAFAVPASARNSPKGSAKADTRTKDSARGSVKAATRPGTPSAAEKALRNASMKEFGSADGCVETIDAARKVGIDFKKVVELCYAGDGRGMHLLFWLGANGGLDAASSEGYAAVLGEILRSKGDRVFAAALRKESTSVRRAVGDSLRYDLGDDDKEMRRYPRTFRAVVSTAKARS